ncbi:hypothetical protein FRC10_004987 [Ceratobasidium sp. 414]|nr:hypothetical protein FRC10_004987 [Ceratobasidium sp. 414]
MAAFLSYGVSNIAMGFTLLFRPDALYDSILAHYIHQKTGFRMTDVRTAPGFNNAIACMTLAVGAGATRASMTGSRTAQSCIGTSFHTPNFHVLIDRHETALMSVVWTAGVVTTCVVNPEITSATHVIAAVLDTGFSIALLWSGGFSIPELLGLGQVRGGGNGSGKPRPSRRRS